MPIYEYRCSECGEMFEKMESITSEEKTKECPGCGQTAERIISQSGFMLKGGGWYSQGYEAKPSCSSASAEKPACSTCPAAK